MRGLIVQSSEQLSPLLTRAMNSLTASGWVHGYPMQETLFYLKTPVPKGIPLIDSLEQFALWAPQFVVDLSNQPTFELQPRTLHFALASCVDTISEKKLEDTRLNFICQNKSEQDILLRKNIAPSRIVDLSQADISFAEHLESHFRIDALGPYTLDGNPLHERAIDEVVRRIQLCAFARFGRNSQITVLLVGGYGRGEGGLLKIGDQFVPSNNLDVLVLYQAPSPYKYRSEITRFGMDIKQLEDEYSLSIDFGHLPARVLEQKKLKLFCFDFANGHKLLLGDDRFLKSKRCGDVGNVPLDELMLLAANRSALVWLNRWIARSPVAQEYRELMLRHVMKSLIANGDYFLFVNGQYSWSYREKLARVESGIGNLPANLGSLYIEASRFRFFPDYTKFSAEDLAQLNQSALKTTRAAFADYAERQGGTVADLKRLVFKRARSSFFQPRRYFKFFSDWGFMRKLRREKIKMPWMDACFFLLFPNELKMIALLAFLNFHRESSDSFADWALRGDPENFFVEVWYRWGDPNFGKLKNKIEGSHQ